MLLSSIRLKNILSFRDVTLKLGALNVLIGPNGVGKSNLVEVIGLLQAAPTALNSAIVRGGGAREWISKAQDASADASIECLLRTPPAQYSLRFTAVERVFQIQRERLQSITTRPKQRPTVYFNREGVGVSIGAGKGDTSPLESVFSQFKRPDDPSPITRLGRELDRIKIYTDFNTGPRSQARTGLSTGVRGEILDADGGNLAMVLNEMVFSGSVGRIKEFLKQFNEEYEDVRIQITSGVAQTYLIERRLSAPIPATRLSDGTLKFLCLLAVLFNPKTPSLVCIEEPELGLHPDALRLVTDALVEASQRMQIIVTTHSKELVDALSERPEDVIVCERDFDNSTRFDRLSRKKLQLWLDRYSLGELWRKGEIGGNRW